MSGTFSIARRDDHLLAVVSGSPTLPGALKLMRSALETAEEAGCGRILVDLRSSVRSLTTFEKFELGEKMSLERHSGRRIAYVVSPRDGASGFFETVARNRGVCIRRFSEEAAALAWLRSTSASPAP